MSTERTFSIIKPDAVERNKIGEITAMLENAGSVSYTHLTLPTILRV